MKTLSKMFIEGVVSVCMCGRELHVPTDVAGTVPNGDGYIMVMDCKCGRKTKVVADKNIHGQTAAAMRRHRLGHDVPPVSPEEHLLKDWRDTLMAVTDRDDLVAMIAGEADGAT